MKESVKFWVTSLVLPLLIPIALAVVGYWINNTLQQNQQSLDKIKFSDQMVTEVFDTSNVNKSLARVELLPDMVDDQKFVNTLTTLVINFWLEKAKEAANEGNDSIFENIYSAAKNFKQQGSALGDSIKNNPELRKADSAYIYEQQGLHDLQLGNLTSARNSFQHAHNAHREFHSTLKLLNITDSIYHTNDDSVYHSKSTSDSVSTAVGQAILHTIKSQYAYKFHAGKPVIAQKNIGIY